MRYENMLEESAIFSDYRKCNDEEVSKSKISTHNPLSRRKFVIFVIEAVWKHILAKMVNVDTNSIFSFLCSIVGDQIRWREMLL